MSKETSRTKQINIPVPEDLAEGFKRTCEALQVSQAAFLRDVLENAVVLYDVLKDGDSDLAKME